MKTPYNETIKFQQYIKSVHDYVFSKNISTPDDERIHTISTSIKKLNSPYLAEVGFKMSKLVPENCTLIPIPSSKGDTSVNKQLADEIAKHKNCKVLDVLGLHHELPSSRITRKGGGAGKKVQDFNMTIKEPIEDVNIYLVDNVVIGGNTIRGAWKALGQKCPAIVWAQTSNEDWKIVERSEAIKNNYIKEDIFIEAKQQDFDIHFQTQSVIVKSNKKISETKFDIVFQTTSQSIEKYCKKNFESILRHKLYSQAEIQQLFAMRKYIENNLNESDKNYIKNYFFEKGWIAPLKKNTKSISIALDEFDAKMWTDKELPYLEIKGTVKLDMEIMLDEYIKDKFIKIEKPYKQKITQLENTIKFHKSFPLLLTYKGGLKFKQVLLNMVTDRIKSRRTNYIKSELEKNMNIKQIGTFKSEITWTSNTSIKVLVNDSMKLLKLKAKKNILPLTAGYLMLRKRK